MLIDAATARTLPPASTREIARSRKSIDKGFPSSCPVPASLLKSILADSGNPPILPNFIPL